MDDLPLLIVEDETDLRELLADYLVGLGWTVEATADGPEAEAALARASFAAVVVDWTVPKGDAIALVLKARERNPACAAIVTTGHAADVVPDSIADAVLRKPFTLRGLSVRLEALVSGARSGPAG